MFGPKSTTSAQNSCPSTTSRFGSMRKGAPDSRAASTSFSVCWTVWRSEPQIPQARVFTSTWPLPGSGSGTVSQTIR